MGARFGYIQDQHHHEINSEEVKEIPADVLMKFQEFHGIATTGVLDKATLEVMKLPRCRVKDFHPDVSQHRSCHLTMPNSPLAYNWGKWDKTTLTWRVTKYSCRSNPMPKELVDQSLRRAFSKWERHSPIRFKWLETGIPDPLGDWRSWRRRRIRRQGRDTGSRLPTQWRPHLRRLALRRR